MENGNTQVKYTYLKNILKYNIWVNILSYFPSLLNFRDAEQQSELINYYEGCLNDVIHLFIRLI